MHNASNVTTKTNKSGIVIFFKPIAFSRHLNSAFDSKFCIYSAEESPIV